MSDHEDLNDSDHAEPEDDTSMSPIDGPRQGESSAERVLELKAMKMSLEALEPLSGESRRRALDWLVDALEVPIRSATPPHHEQELVAPRGEAATSTYTPTPKEFLSLKKPQTSSERIACLAFYLNRYRNHAQFRRSDIAELNRESASHPFGNLSRDLSMADRRDGYIVQAGSGTKQMTARGEAIVDALPEREAVQTALKENEFRKKRPGNQSRRPSSGTSGEES